MTDRSFIKNLSSNRISIRSHSVQGLSMMMVVMMLLLLSLNLQLVSGQNMTGNFTEGPMTDFNLTLAPNNNETAVPTIPEPVGNVTAAPSVAETTNGTAVLPVPPVDTLGPTTESPTFTPTPPPTNSTTEAPSLAPSASPTVSPTNATTEPPTTIAPTTMAPTNVTTEPPTTLAPTTMAPTNATTTEAPTVVVTTEAPTENITEVPVEEETDAPTSAPTTTEMPSAAPTTMSIAPSAAPTEAAAEGTAVAQTVKGVVLTLVGMRNAMTSAALEEWKTITETHTTEYYARQPETGITNVETSIMEITQRIDSVRRLSPQHDDGGKTRNLQTTTTTPALVIAYSQDISFRTVNPSRDTADAILRAPFASQLDRNRYVDSLSNANDAFADLVSLEELVINDNAGGVSQIVEEGGDDDGLGTGAIIGIVVGCVAAVALVLGIGYFVSQRGDDGGYVNAGKTPPAQLDVGYGDEVSTLAEPHTGGGRSGIRNTQSAEGLNYGDQSVATVDYDYSKAYGGGGDTSVSSAGGTFGSQTHTHAAGGAATLSGLAGANGGPLEASYAESGSQFRGQNANVREELIDIYAPPGKLGVVIDTPDDGAPVVHAVKDSSVIFDKLQVGDKLVAVDDEDVRSMTAIKVSKVISRKSANASRKLSIIRTVVVDE